MHCGTESVRLFRVEAWTLQWPIMAVLETIKFLSGNLNKYSYGQKSHFSSFSYSGGPYGQAGAGRGGHSHAGGGGGGMAVPSRSQGSQKTVLKLSVPPL
ncbi:hypothetical protein LguiA_017550 [Lonicera macranthoides]